MFRVGSIRWRHHRREGRTEGVVGVIRDRGIRIGLLRQPVQLVVSVGNELVFAVDKVAGVLFPEFASGHEDPSQLVLLNPETLCSWLFLHFRASCITVFLNLCPDFASLQIVV
jgi:hypothetical protein